MISKVLIAIDGSRYSETVLNNVIALQLSSSTEITALHVIQEHMFLGRVTLRKFWDQANIQSAHKVLEEAGLELLKIPCNRLRETGMQVDEKVTFGKPAEEILKIASRIKPDLIVIGVKGARNSTQFPLGSVAQRVMKYSRTSVLLARSDMKSLRSIIVATDGSRHSEATVRYILDLPLPRHTKVVVVTSLESHIAALVKMPTLDMATNQKIIEELQMIEEKNASDLIGKSEKKFRGKGYNTESLVLEGYPAEEIIASSAKLNPDIIAIGAKGLGAVNAFLLGSVAQRIAKFSKQSVLITKNVKR